MLQTLRTLVESDVFIAWLAFSFAVDVVAVGRFTYNIARQVVGHMIGGPRV